MAEFTLNGTRFTVPDRPTVRQQLAYRAAIASMRFDDVYEAHWQGVVGLVQEWESDVIADPAAFSMDTSDDPAAADLVFWACNVVAGHMNRLETLPKNSSGGQ